MITNVVDFGDSVASDVMVPRIDIEFMDVESSYEDVLAVFRRDKYSRVPVYEGNKDHVIGVLKSEGCFLLQRSSLEFLYPQDSSPPILHLRVQENFRPDGRYAEEFHQYGHGVR